jgi:AcrR family transcriptional regulator
MKKQPEKTAQTRAKLMSAFWELYKSKSITKITVRDITDKAGLYRSTFYLYFTDVYDVLEQLENDVVQSWENEIVQQVKSYTFEELIDAIATFYEVKGEYVSVLLDTSGNPRILQKFRDALKPRVREILTFSPTDLEFEFIFEFYLRGMLGILTHWYRCRRNIPAKDVVALGQSLLADKIAPVLRVQE